MDNIKQLKHEIKAIKARNKKVEADKAWETSLSRKILIVLLTYFVIVLFFHVANLPKPFVNATVPTLGFILSTLTVPLFKRLWIKKVYRNKRES